MKRLFCLRDKAGKVVNYDGWMYFESKDAARALRIVLNGQDKEGNELFGTGHRISLGPDHWRYHNV